MGWQDPEEDSGMPTTLARQVAGRIWGEGGVHSLVPTASQSQHLEKAPSSQASSLQKYEEQISVIYKLLNLWHFIIAA